MSYVGLALNFLFIAGITAASYSHFDRRETEPAGATLLSAFTAVGAAANTFVWFQAAFCDPLRNAIAIAVATTACTLFLLAVGESRGGGLLLAFSSGTPPAILKHGVYGHVRHPFYLSYMIFWWGWWALNDFHVVSLLIAALMTAIYVIAAQKEELLLAHAFGARYVDYTRSTKQFVPWVY